MLNVLPNADAPLQGLTPPDHRDRPDDWQESPAGGEWKDWELAQNLLRSLSNPGLQRWLDLNA